MISPRKAAKQRTQLTELRVLQEVDKLRAVVEAALLDTDFDGSTGVSVTSYHSATVQIVLNECQRDGWVAHVASDVLFLKESSK